ncbi:transposase [Pseudomonas syringae pv. actinidiae]|uniref:REP-associated tyrosine transposase n=1 Tax=Pseudomonas syringae TaxID=317 RepID=UPI000BB583CE|nr:transposase [Pseudomonas syringae]PBK48103.1 transposase [Pseudomonas syringae pv. actinidiae]PBK53093.1 transposase [Pseudomonas syringae pv. actinidiae]RJX56093.1 transposase [Pseudomonas syringae pv. actinidiae]
MNERAQSHRLRTGRISGAGQIYLVTAKTFQRNPVFSDWRMGRLLVDELRQIQEQQLADSLAWVVMPDHIHWLLQLNGQSLSRVVQRVKSKSAIAINRAKGCSGPFWQSGFHDISVRNEDSLVNYARYVAPGVRIVVASPVFPKKA